jgi:hypothetical protein
MMSSQLGGALAPLLVVPIQMRYGWRASFYLFGVLGIGWAIVWYWWFRDSPAEMPAVSRQERAEIGVSPRSHHALPWGQAARSGNLWSVMGMAASYGYTLYFFQSWFPTYLVKGRGFTEAASCCRRFHSSSAPRELRRGLPQGRPGAEDGPDVGPPFARRGGFERRGDVHDRVRDDRGQGVVAAPARAERWLHHASAPSSWRRRLPRSSPPRSSCVTLAALTGFYQ